MAPPPKVTAKITLAPATAVPNASFTMTTGARATADPGTAVWLSPVFFEMLAGTPTGAVPVAAKVTVAVTPAADARRWFSPGVGPSVQPVDARPDASVVEEAGLTVPPPSTMVNETGTPATALPSASLTRTTGNRGRSVETTADWLSPDEMATDVGIPGSPPPPLEVVGPQPGARTVTAKSAMETALPALNRM